MVNIKTRILVLAILSIAAFLFGCVSQVEQINKNITASEALDILNENKDNPDFTLLDVRTPEEFATEHVEGALNINYFSEDFSDKIDNLDKDDTYLVYCAAGKRGGFALEVLKQKGFREAYNIEGGIAACKEEAFDIVTNQE